MTTKAGDVLEGGLEFGLQLVAIVGLCLGAVWMWPDGLLRTPFASLTLADALSALASVLVWLVALAWLYFVAEPLRLLEK
jgi:hypothetical protein